MENRSGNQTERSTNTLHITSANQLRHRAPWSKLAACSTDDTKCEQSKEIAGMNPIRIASKLENGIPMARTRIFQR